MKFSVAIIFVALSAGASLAENVPAVLYHVQDNTFGCANPNTTRALTDPQEARRGNAKWVKKTMTDGLCVSISPQSPWKLVSLEGDVALMSYAGSVGQPGAFYLSVADLIDSSNRHPGDSSAAVGASARIPTDASATALAPDPQRVGQPVSASDQASAPGGGKGVIWVAVITALAVLAGLVVLFLQRGTPARPNNKS